MNECNRCMNILIDVLDGESKRTNYQKLVDPLNKRYSDCSDTDTEYARPSMICTAPIPMKITCVRKRKVDEGPIGRITRNQDFDMIGSKFVYRCTCGTRNGLDSNCRRVSCQGNPGCHMNPPRCWPRYRPEPEDRREIEGPIRLCYYIDDKE